MSEFYFDYKCIALSGKKKEEYYNQIEQSIESDKEREELTEKLLQKSNDKALDFFLYQDYETGKMKVQVYIPKSLQNRENYNEIRLYTFEQGVGFPSVKSLDSKNCVHWKISGGDNTVSHDNAIFIQPKGDTKVPNLSCTGIIAFMRKGNDEPLEDDCYLFSINYGRKEIIRYQIEEHFGVAPYFDVHIFYNRLYDDVVLNIVGKNNCKPLFIEDIENDDNYFKDANGKKVEIILKKFGKDNNYIKHRYPTEKVRGYDFRLSFKDKKFNKFYLLLDDSDYTIEDMETRKKQIRVEKKSKIDKTRRCPYCNRVINPDVSKVKTGIVTCDGRILSNSVPTGIVDKKIIVCGSEDKIKKSEGVLQAEHFILPQNAEKYPSINIAVSGFPSSGKTVFLASLINLSKNGNYYTADPFVLNKISESINGKTSGRVSYIEMKHVDEVKGIYRVFSDQEDKRGRFVDNVNIKERYAINVNSKLEKQTQGSIGKILAWNPIGFAIPKIGFTYFYDVPGEAFKGEYGKLRTFDVADGIIAVIDGNNKKESSTGTYNPIIELDETLKSIRKLANKSVDLTTKPIAIVLTKLDLRIADYLSEKVDKKTELGKCFDPNCHILKEDMLSMLSLKRGYKGSEIERHIDLSSYEIIHYLHTLSKEDVAKLKDILNTYKNIKFFTCSALGGDDVLEFEKGTETGTVKYSPRRLRIELPIIWLFHKKGLIK